MSGAALFMVKVRYERLSEAVLFTLKVKRERLIKNTPLTVNLKNVHLGLTVIVNYLPSRNSFAEKFPMPFKLISGFFYMKKFCSFNFLSLFFVNSSFEFVLFVPFFFNFSMFISKN